jgi:hypothetical protein
MIVSRYFFSWGFDFFSGNSGPFPDYAGFFSTFVDFPVSKIAKSSTLRG